MCDTYILRLSQHHAQQLIEHLYPGDGKEAVAIAACSYERKPAEGLFDIHEVLPIPLDRCISRSRCLVQWAVADIEDFIVVQTGLERVISVFHSHPNGAPCFSHQDDIADRSFRTELTDTFGTKSPLISAIMLPDTTMRARIIHEQGGFSIVDEVRVLPINAPTTTL